MCALDGFRLPLDNLQGLQLGVRHRELLGPAVLSDFEGIPASGKRTARVSFAASPPAPAAPSRRARLANKGKRDGQVGLVRVEDLSNLGFRVLLRRAIEDPRA